MERAPAREPESESESGRARVSRPPQPALLASGPALPPPPPRRPPRSPPASARPPRRLAAHRPPHRPSPRPLCPPALRPACRAPRPAQRRPAARSRMPPQTRTARSQSVPCCCSRSPPGSRRTHTRAPPRRPRKQRSRSVVPSGSWRAIRAGCGPVSAVRATPAGLGSGNSPRLRRLNRLRRVEVGALELARVCLSVRSSVRRGVDAVARRLIPLLVPLVRTLLGARFAPLGDRGSAKRLRIHVRPGEEVRAVACPGQQERNQERAGDSCPRELRRDISPRQPAA